MTAKRIDRIEIHQPVPPVARQPVRLAPSPEHLAGREQLLAELGARLSASDVPGPRTVVLCGMGGVGKTSLPLAYAHRHLGEVEVAWQFACEDPAVLAAGFGELADQLAARERADTRDPVASVHAVLAAFEANWLLIFDNVADQASVDGFLPPAGPGRVLITSQNQNWPSGQALDVPVLDPEVAADFLIGRSGDPDRQAAARLAEELGGLPLALEQAAAYRKATGDSLAGYLASFRHRRAGMLARGEPTGYDKTVAATWSLAFDRLEQPTAGAVGLLRMLAFCAPEAIPWRLLLQPRPALTTGLGTRLRYSGEVLTLSKEDPLAARQAMAVGRLTKGMRRQVAKALVLLVNDPLAAGEAIAALSQYSLVSPAAAGQVQVHRLVQAVTVDRMPEKLARAWRQAAAAVIEAAIPRDTDEPDNWPDFAALLPHAQAALPADSDGMGRLASYLGDSGSYVAARDLCRTVVTARVQVLGPEHQFTLAARAALAQWTGEAGDAAGARDQFAELLPVRERVSGPEHPDTLSSRGNFARWIGGAGDAAGARDHLAALLPVRERVSGPEHPATLITRAVLAMWTGEAGDAAGARDQYAGLLPVRERVSGPEHPDTLTDRINLATWTAQAGDLAGGRDQLAGLLPVLQRVLGPEHPATLTAGINLAQWTGLAGDAARARVQFAALLPMIERVLGPEHPDTLTARVNFAHWTGLAEDAAAARDQLAELLPVLERVFGPQHPTTLTARINLAVWTWGAGDVAGAQDQQAALLPVLERVLGPEHPDTLTARANLAYWTGQAGDAAGPVTSWPSCYPSVSGHPAASTQTP